jgi:hypothetical protein
MDSENTSTISDWISKYQPWATAPPKLKKIVAEYFLISQELEFDQLGRSINFFVKFWPLFLSNFT